MLLNKKFRIIISILIVLITTGCQRTVMREGSTPGLRIRDASMPQARIRLNSVNIVDPNLQERTTRVFGQNLKLFSKNADYVGKIAVENHGGKRTPTGTMRIYVVMRNRTEYPQQVECRALFFDQDEIPVEGPTSWQRVYLNQNGIGTCNLLSTKIDTAYYYVEIREGR